MQKRDFIQQAVIQWMPAMGWDYEKALKSAEKAWFMLSQRGYGDANKQGPRPIPNAYQQLSKHAVMKAAFDLFWVAYDHKKGREEAAARWLQMGEQTKAEYDKIIAGAKREAQARKNLPEGQIPKMAQGWLTEKRWQDYEETQVDTEQKQRNEQAMKLRQINQDLAHAKRMAADTSDDYWHNEVHKLTEQLRQLRNAHD